MTRWLLLAGLLVAYALVIVPFGASLKSRPVEVKLGYLPHPQVLRAGAGEHRPTVAGFVVMRLLFYYGTVLQKLQEQVIIRPESQNMYQTLRGASQLDPYNMDTYYFAQAAFTWDLGRIKEVNQLLEEGTRYRSWDPWLPFYLGFNYGYFLKDYPRAAVYMQRAAELSGEPLFAKLASRYFYESEQSSFALAFLETMIKTAKSQAVRKGYEMRRDALLAVTAIEKARDKFLALHGRLPEDIRLLVGPGLLPAVPADPYGGIFYLDRGGKVRTTSNLVDPSGGEKS